MATTQQKARILTLEDVKHLRYPLPESWKRAAGLLKGRKNLIDPVKYQRRIRQEWEERLKRQLKLATKSHS